MKKPLIFNFSRDKKFLFYFLSFTWGFLTSIIGFIVILILKLKKHKVFKFGFCWIIELKNINFGISLGPFIFCWEGNTKQDYEAKCHELGHSLQNVYFGPFFPIFIAIPSVIRFWIREFRTKSNNKPKTSYDSIWFEGSATNSGIKFMKEYTEGGLK